MSESLWESNAAVDAGPELVEMSPEGKAMAEDAAAPQQSAEPETLTVSLTDFAALEERVLRAVTLVKQERQARTAAEGRAERAEAALSDQIPRVEQLQAELDALRAERDQVKTRVERLLSQLDALEL